MSKSKLADYRPQSRNANRHTQRGMGLLEKSIQQDGWIGAITVAADGETFDGSARIEVGAATGFEDAIVVESDGTRPVVVRRVDIASADDPRAKRLGIAANRVAELNLSWEVDELLASVADGVDLSALFREDELDALLQAAHGQDEKATGEDKGAQVDRADELGRAWGVQSGQLWEIPSATVKGKAHRLLCGDSTDKEDVARLMDNKKAEMVWTDPPYGVQFMGAGGDSIAGDITYTAIPLMFAIMPTVLSGKAWFYICGGANNESLYSRMIEHYFRMTPRIVVWDKCSTVMRHNAYHSTYEFIYFGFQQGGGDRWFSGRAGEAATDMWRIPKPGNDRVHLTEKPVELPRRAIINSCPPDAVVLDFFLGSGSCVVAAEQTGRVCYGLELAEGYVAVILQRLSDMGLEPRLIG